MSKRVIIVEDDENIREMVSMFLEMKGYIVSLASEGKEALDLIEKTQHDILITDVNMPHGMGGIELITNLIKNEYSSPIIVMSGHLDNQSKVVKVSEKITFLEKPVSMNDLVKKIEELTSNPLKVA